MLIQRLSGAWGSSRGTRFSIYNNHKLKKVYNICFTLYAFLNHGISSLLKNKNY